MAKQCPCGSQGPFYKHRGKPDGLTHECQVCMKRRHQAWAAKHPEKAKAATKRWKENNPERVTRSKLSWACDNPEKSQAARTKHRLGRYGLDLKTWQDLFNLQGGVCGVCGEPMLPTGRKSNSAVVDHDHATGSVRGLLHSRCNVALGLLLESPEQLRRAADYLEKHHALRCIRISDTTDSSGTPERPRG